MLEPLEARRLLAIDTFVNPAGGDWFVASNWSLNQVPQPGADVVIPALAGGQPVTYGLNPGQSAASLKSLTLDGRLVLSASLAVSGDVSGAGRLTVSDDFQGHAGALTGGTIVSDLVIVGANGSLKGVTISGHPTVLSAPDGTVFGSNLTVDGTVTLGNGDRSGHLDFTESQTLAGRGAVVFAQGELVVGQTGTLTIGPDLTVSGNEVHIDGVVTATPQGVTDNSKLIVQGKIDITGDDSSLSFTSLQVTIARSGHLAVAAVSSISRINGDPNVVLTNTLVNSGLVTLGSNVIVQVGYPGFNPTGFTQNPAGTLDLGIGDPPVNGRVGFGAIVANKAALAGTLVASLVGGYRPSNGQTFTAVSAAATTGKFGQFTGNGLGVSYVSSNVVLTPTNPTKLPDIDLINVLLSPGELDFNYITSGSPGPFRFGLFRSADPTSIPDGSAPLAVYQVTNSSNEDGYGFFDLTGIARDAARPYLVVAGDDRGLVAEANEGNNTRAVSYAPRKPAPDLAATAPSFGAGGGVDFGYSIGGADLPQAAQVALYWAGGTKLASVIGDPIDVLTTPLTQGASGPIHLTPDQMGHVPDGAKYLLVVADPRDADHPDGLISESDEGNNVATLPLSGGPGTIVRDVILPDVTTPIPTIEAITGDRIDLHYKSIALEFTIQAPTEPGVISDALSNEATLPMSLLDVDTREDMPISTSTAQVELAVFGPTAASQLEIAPRTKHIGSIRWVGLGGYDTQDNIVLNGPYVPGDALLRWTTSGFTVKTFPREVTFINPVPLTYWVDLDKLGVDPASHSFEQIIRVAEDYIHKALATTVFQGHPLLPFVANFLFQGDPGQTDLIVTDPQGQRAGMTRDGNVLLEIPGSVYFASYPLVVIPDPAPGAYQTEIRGRTSGDYEFYSALAGFGEPPALTKFSGTLNRGQSVTYVATLDPTQGTLASRPQPPVLDPIPDQQVEAGKRLSVAAHATDPNTQITLHYSLDPGAPAGASIDPATGVVTWAVPITQPPGLSTITVRVADDGKPSLSAATAFHIMVTASASPPDPPPSTGAPSSPPTGTTPVAIAPAVTGILGVGHSKKGLSAITVAFNEALSPASASNPGAYRAFAGVKKRRKVAFTKALRIKSITYAAGGIAVTVTLAKPFKGKVLVTVRGDFTSPGGATGHIDTSAFVP